MKKFAPVALFLTSLCMLAAGASADEAKPVRIMPVGDSITEGGKAFSNYRHPLGQKLAAAGYRIVFVGSRKSDSPDGPLEHEGYGGRNAEFLAATLGKTLADHPADIVLIHAGHNHTVEEKPIPGILKATESMIAIARKANPKMIVMLAQVIPSGKLPKYSYIPDLNAALAELAKKLNTPEQPVILVDQATGFDPAKDTIADKVHPNAAGAQKMASQWFEALRKVLVRP